MESVGAGVLARAASLFLLTTHAAHARRSGITARGRCDDPLSGLALLPASHEVPSFAELFVFSSGHRKVWKEGQKRWTARRKLSGVIWAMSASLGFVYRSPGLRSDAMTILPNRRQSPGHGNRGCLFTFAALNLKD